VRFVPGVGGAALVSVGLAMLAPWLGVVAAGLLLLSIDRRVT
jgi:hypothetical protein